MVVNIDSLIIIIIMIINTKELPLSPSSGKPSPDNTCLRSFTLCQTNATTSLVSGWTKFSLAHSLLDTCWKLRHVFYFSSLLSLAIFLFQMLSQELFGFLWSSEDMSTTYDYYYYDTYGTSTSYGNYYYYSSSTESSVSGSECECLIELYKRIWALIAWLSLNFIL